MVLDGNAQGVRWFGNQKFSRALTAKILWILIHKNILWGRFMATKYILGMTFLEWIRLPRKSNVPLKEKIYLWLIMENKILTWDNTLKWGWNGPNRFPLC
jgi:hypothetical protein